MQRQAESIDEIAADLDVGPTYYLVDCYGWGLTVTECYPGPSWRESMRDLADRGLIQAHPCEHPLYNITELGQQVRRAILEKREAERALHGRH